MELSKYLVIIFVICGFVGSLRIDCEIHIYSLTKYCKVNELKVLENDIALTEVLASYTTEIKSNDDFTVFWIPSEVETERVPTKICDFLRNLERIQIFGTKIHQINREVFTNCKKVSVVWISLTSLTTLPEDLFVDLVELTELYLYDNKLVSLPADLLLKNTKIKKLEVQDNRLSTIDTELPSTLTWISFRGNVCIDKNFPSDIADFNLFIHEVASNCECPMKKSYRSKVIAIEKTLSEKEEENANLKHNKETCQREKDALATNVTQLMTINENLKNEIEELKTDISANEMDKSAEMLRLLSENQSLKLNYENLLKTLADLTKSN